jgi:hypothetical protein
MPACWDSQRRAARNSPFTIVADQAAPSKQRDEDSTMPTRQTRLHLAPGNQSVARHRCSAGAHLGPIHQEHTLAMTEFLRAESGRRLICRFFSERPHNKTLRGLIDREAEGKRRSCDRPD